MKAFIETFVVEEVGSRIRKLDIFLDTGSALAFYQDFTVSVAVDAVNHPVAWANMSPQSSVRAVNFKMAAFL